MSIIEKGFFKNKIYPKPKHMENGEYRRFYSNTEQTFVLPNGEEVKIKYSGSDRFGNDIYCAACDHWSTVAGTSILFSVMGVCKCCGVNFQDTKDNLKQELSSR